MTLTQYKQELGRQKRPFLIVLLALLVAGLALPKPGRFVMSDVSSCRLNIVTDCSGNLRTCGQCGNPATHEHKSGLIVYDSCSKPECQKAMRSLVSDFRLRVTTGVGC